MHSLKKYAYLTAILNMIILYINIPILFSSFIAKLLVTVGSRWSEEFPVTSEVIDLFDESSTCQSLPDAPYSAYRNTGGIVGMENLPLVCGGPAGQQNQAKCFILGNDSWDTVNTIEDRGASSSIVINKQVRSCTIYNLKTTECCFAVKIIFYSVVDNRG